MATEVGWKGVILIGANPIADIQNWTLNEYVEKVAAHITGSSTRRYLVGQFEADGTIACTLDAADATGQELLGAGATATLLLMSDGQGSGLRQASVDAIIERVEEQVDPSNPNRRTFTWWTNGPVDRTPQT